MIQCRLSAEELNFLLSGVKKVSAVGNSAGLPGNQANGHCDEIEIEDHTGQRKGGGEDSPGCEPKEAQ